MYMHAPNASGVVCTDEGSHYFCKVVEGGNRPSEHSGDVVWEGNVKKVEGDDIGVGAFPSDTDLSQYISGTGHINFDVPRDAGCSLTDPERLTCGSWLGE